MNVKVGYRQHTLHRRLVATGVVAMWLAGLAGVPVTSAGVALAQGNDGPDAVVTATAPALDDPFVVPVQNNTFTKPELTVPVGTTVTWVNLDQEQHDVMESEDYSFMSPLIDPGTSWSLTFETPGVYPYWCDLHANMTGIITVVG